MREYNPKTISFISKGNIPSKRIRATRKSADFQKERLGIHQSVTMAINKLLVSISKFWWTPTYRDNRRFYSLCADIKFVIWTQNWHSVRTEFRIMNGEEQTGYNHWRGTMTFDCFLYFMTRARHINISIHLSVCVFVLIDWICILCMYTKSAQPMRIRRLYEITQIGSFRTWMIFWNLKSVQRYIRFSYYIPFIFWLLCDSGSGSGIFHNRCAIPAFILARFWHISATNENNINGDERFVSDVIDLQRRQTRKSEI